MKLDALDKAFYAIGIGEYLNKNRLVNVDLWGGELGFVDACMGYAEVVDFPEPEAYAGVFAYEVAQPLGNNVAEYLNTFGASTPPDLLGCIACLFRQMNGTGDQS